ncbi:unnamed protein product [Urochloa decumbens]|uniref:NADP-dependent oxidoreductase domain-containing protein n=1 Tax=Urochloa decumbens TaxID=240449 RepID=A0ABC8YFB1_9POAL
MAPSHCDTNNQSNAVPVAMPAAVVRLGKPTPRIGFGTASATLGQAEGRAGVTQAVLHALDAGYRHFDTASSYNTEAAVGDAVAQAVRAGKIASRDDLYITTKLWIADAHPGRVLPALQKSLWNLRMEYVDMYLIHFPVSMWPPAVEGAIMVVKDDLVEMDMKGVWEEMEECHRRGLARAIGVSNFTCKKLEYLLSFTKIPPAANQVVNCNPSSFGMSRTVIFLWNVLYCRLSLSPPTYSVTHLPSFLFLYEFFPCCLHFPFAHVLIENEQVEVHPYCRQNKLRAYCRDKGIQLCAYSPLGGKGAPWANNSVMDSPILEQIAHEKGKTVAQVGV